MYNNIEEQDLFNIENLYLSRIIHDSETVIEFIMISIEGRIHNGAKKIEDTICDPKEEK